MGSGERAQNIDNGIIKFRCIGDMLFHPLSGVPERVKFLLFCLLGGGSFDPPVMVNPGIYRLNPDLAISLPEALRIFIRLDSLMRADDPYFLPVPFPGIPYPIVRTPEMKEIE